MWKTNVLRWRKWYDPARLRHGAKPPRNPGERLPITEEEFQDALERVLPNIGSLRARSLGFAVSGGVDSMALAYLYARARKANTSLPQPHGFIVDHKVRPESTEEAAWVAEQLRSKFGMASSILTLTWPDGFDASDTRRFETEARTRRYQALGRACRDHEITCLMLAHHGDDQAETVLMRLANNRLRTGLKGMRSIEWIPECEGIHGVYHSSIQQPEAAGKIPFPIEQGGIQILRPLLAMEKSRLIATCKEKDIEWAEDQTNQIQSLTTRNAIRHIYKAHRLPNALSIPSLVDVSRHMQKRMNAHRAYANQLFDKCLLRLDIQTGTLLVRFPPFASLLGRPIETESDKNEAKDNAYLLIERVADLVTPKSRPALGQLAPRVSDIYPEFLTQEHNERIAAEGKTHFREKFTVYHLWWRKWDKSSPFEDHGLPSEDYSSTAPHPREWLLTRQALEFGEGEKLQIAIPPTQTLHGSEKNSESEPSYHMFDGRYWIKLYNYTRDTLTIRIFEKADMRHLPMTQSNQESTQVRTGPTPERFIMAAFALLKPADVRFTLPAVFRKDNATGKETLVGFPTLNIRMYGLGPPKEICDWHVRYKKIDFGQHAVGDMIVPGLKRVDLDQQEKAARRQHKDASRWKGHRAQVARDDSDRRLGYKRVYENTGDLVRRRWQVARDDSVKFMDYDGEHEHRGPLQDTPRAVEGEHVKRESEMKKALQNTPKAMQGDSLDGLNLLLKTSERQNKKR